jgi:hypothetical protein
MVRSPTASLREFIVVALFTDSSGEGSADGTHGMTRNKHSDYGDLYCDLGSSSHKRRHNFLQRLFVCSVGNIEVVSFELFHSHFW